MAIYLYTFHKPITLPADSLQAVEWSWMLWLHKASGDFLPAGRSEDVSSDVSSGPRRSVLVTYESPREKDDVVGQLEVFRSSETAGRGGRKESPASERESHIETAYIDESHQFAPVYQTGEKDAEVTVYRLARYVPLKSVQKEDALEVETFV